MTHGTDTILWRLRWPSLTDSQIEVARRWLDAVDLEKRRLLNGYGGKRRGADEVLSLNENKTIGWKKDEQWEKYRRLGKELGLGDLDVVKANL